MLYKIFNFNSYEILLSQWDLTHSYSHQEDRRLFECYQHITFVSWFHYLSSKTILKSRGPFQAQKCREVFAPKNALAKSQTSWLQSCFMYSYILNTNRGSRSSYKKFQWYTLLCLWTTITLAKIYFSGPKRFRGFRETAPLPETARSFVNTKKDTCFPNANDVLIKLRPVAHKKVQGPDKYS